MISLDIIKHKTNLSNILIDIYKDNLLASSLGFKGGTAAMFFYNLSRLSVDLDFDYIYQNEIVTKEVDQVIERVTKILSTKYEIKDQSKKYKTLFWLVNYQSGLRNIKVEISTRKVPFNHYKLKDFYGVKINILDIRDMIAHKLIAVTERKSLANRDLFDIHFFLSSKYAAEINYKIIEDRMGKNPQEFYQYLLKFIDRIDKKNILDGIGELLDDKQKVWVKSKMLIELKGLIERQCEMLSIKL